MNRTTLKLMIAIGMIFWFATVVHRGPDWGVLLLSAVLVSWSVFHLMADGEDKHRE